MFKFTDCDKKASHQHATMQKDATAWHVIVLYRPYVQIMHTSTVLARSLKFEYMKRTSFIDIFLMGKHNDERIYLSPPSWDCGWYWGFGYLGNRNCHYHMDGLMKDTNLFDGIKKHFGDTLTIKNDSDLWQFCELMGTFYTLKEAAEVLWRGGSHYTTNPITDKIKNEKEVARINNEVMPALFDAIHAIIKKYQ